MNGEELEMDVHEVAKKVKTLFDALGYRKTEGEDKMRQELKQVCLDFADKYPELGKLSFMKRRGKERYFITILLMIEDIDATIISRVLDVDQATVTRHKYNVRKEIEQLYPEGSLIVKSSICFMTVSVQEENKFIFRVISIYCIS